MELKIYDKKNIIKTYEIDHYNVEFWIIEDLLNVINIDDLNSLSQKENETEPKNN